MLWRAKAEAGQKSEVRSRKSETEITRRSIPSQQRNEWNEQGDVTADSHNVARGRESCARKNCADVVDLDLDEKERFRWFPACPTVDPCR